MESMFQYSICQGFGTDCKDPISMIKDLQVWPNFSTELEVIQTLQICFSDFKISYIPKAQNDIAASLARTARSLFLLVVLLRSGYQITSSLSNRIVICYRKKNLKTRTGPCLHSIQYHLTIVRGKD